MREGRFRQLLQRTTFVGSLDQYRRTSRMTQTSRGERRRTAPTADSESLHTALIATRVRAKACKATLCQQSAGNEGMSNFYYVHILRSLPA